MLTGQSFCQSPFSCDFEEYPPEKQLPSFPIFMLEDELHFFKRIVLGDVLTNSENEMALCFNLITLFLLNR